MSKYFDLATQAMLDGHKGQPIVLITHDNYPMAGEIGGRLYEKNYYPIFDLTGNDLLKRINKNPTLITSSDCILLHKDLGQYKPSISSIDLIKQIRKWPGGEELRTGVVSGEFTDRGVSKTAREIIGADFGFDSTGWEGILPEWVLKMIGMGRLSIEEIQDCRYNETVVNVSQAEYRINRFRNKPSSKESLN